MMPELSDRDESMPNDAGASVATAAPNKGRPRSEAVSRSILETTLDLIAERGNIKDVSVEAVADRSRVSKTTIYRRWATKEELIANAVESMKAPIDYELPHTSIREDLMMIAGRMRKQFTPREEAVLGCLALEMRTNPELRKFNNEFHRKRRDLVRNTLQLAIDRGELRKDLDIDLATVMLVSPILSIQVYAQHPELATPDLAERVVDNLLEGFRPRD